MLQEFEIDIYDIVIKEDPRTIEGLILEEFRGEKKAFLLDINQSEFTLFEKLIYDISVFHLKRLNINPNDITIECWTHKRYCCQYNLHIDYEYSSDSNDLPILTILSYFTNIKVPTMVTKITEPEALQNNYNTNDFAFIFPAMLKSMSFRGDMYYHGAINTFDTTDICHQRYILGINFWKKPLNIPYFDTNLYYKDNSLFKKLLFVNKDYPLFDLKVSKNPTKHKTLENIDLSNLFTKRSNENDAHVSLKVDRSLILKTFSSMFDLPQYDNYTFFIKSK
jgi:hypothetical protein